MNSFDAYLKIKGNLIWNADLSKKVLIKTEF